MKTKIAATIATAGILAGAGITVADTASAEVLRLAFHSPMMHFSAKADCDAKAKNYDNLVLSKGLVLQNAIYNDQTDDPTHCYLDDAGWTYVTAYSPKGFPQNVEPSSYALTKADGDFSALDYVNRFSYTTYDHEYGGFPTKAACDSTFASVWNKVKSNTNGANLVSWKPDMSRGSLACYKESGKSTYRYRVVYQARWLQNVYDYDKFSHENPLVETPNKNYGTMLPNHVPNYVPDSQAGQDYAF